MIGSKQGENSQPQCEKILKHKRVEKVCVTGKGKTLSVIVENPYET
jgi:hypothetical protein